MNITDNDLEEMEETHPQAQLEARRVRAQAQTPVPLYDLSLAQVEPLKSSAPAGGNMFTKKIGPLPVWGWLGLVTAVAGGGYVWYRVAKSKTVKKNKSEDDSDSEDESEPEDDGRPSGAWSPSRSMFGDKLKKLLAKKGLAGRSTVYVDADEADKDKDLKTVSPLITIKVTGAKVKVDKDLERMCKREGLSPTTHEDGSIGLYPNPSSKRGKEWEEYVDALRDDGQKR